MHCGSVFRLLFTDAFSEIRAADIKIVIAMKKQYRIIKLPKGKGAYRTIYAPTKAYKEKLKSFLLDLQQKVHNLDKDFTIHGFMRGRSPVTNAQKHIGYEYTLSLDLKDFFSDVKLEMVEEYLNEEERELCFIEGIARQGLPTSPLIANLAFIKLDTQIKDALSEEGAYTIYTRYADDMIFSFNHFELAETIENLVAKIVSTGGFRLNIKKRKLQGAKNGRRIITGIAVGERRIYPTRRVKRQIRAALHQKKKAAAIGLLSWSQCLEPRPFYTDRDLLNKHIFHDAALDLSNDFYLSDLLSFEEYVSKVEADFEDSHVVHTEDPEVWEKQKNTFLEQRESFYVKEKLASKERQSSLKKVIEEEFNPSEKEREKRQREVKRSVAQQQTKRMTPARKQETKKQVVDFETLKEIEQEEASSFEEVKKQHRREKEQIQFKQEREEQQKKALNRIFLASIAPIVFLIIAMSYYYANTELEIKPAYPLFVNVTPYDATIEIIDYPPGYTMGITLKPGVYKVKIDKQGYVPQQFSITMEHKPVVVSRELQRVYKRKVY